MNVVSTHCSWSLDIHWALFWPCYLWDLWSRFSITFLKNSFSSFAKFTLCHYKNTLYLVSIHQANDIHYIFSFSKQYYEWNWGKIENKQLAQDHIAHRWGNLNLNLVFYHFTLPIRIWHKINTPQMLNLLSLFPPTKYYCYWDEKNLGVRQE